MFWTFSAKRLICLNFGCSFAPHKNRDVTQLWKLAMLLHLEKTLVWFLKFHLIFFLNPNIVNTENLFLKHFLKRFFFHFISSKKGKKLLFFSQRKNSSNGESLTQFDFFSDYFGLRYKMTSQMSNLDETLKNSNDFSHIYSKKLNQREFCVRASGPKYRYNIKGLASLVSYFQNFPQRSLQ